MTIAEVEGLFPDGYSEPFTKLKAHALALHDKLDIVMVVVEDIASEGCNVKGMFCLTHQQRIPCIAAAARDAVAEIREEK